MGSGGGTLFSVGRWEGSNAAGSSGESADANGGGSTIEGASGTCDALRNAARAVQSSETRSSEDLDIDLDRHREIRDLFGLQLANQGGRQRGLARYLVALRSCGCEGIDFAALERAWTRRMLPPLRNVWAVGLSEKVLANGDRTVGEWLESLPSDPSPGKNGASACIEEAHEIHAWFSYTKIWHRHDPRFDLPRASGDLERFDASRRGPKLVFGPSGVRLDDEQLADDVDDTNQIATLPDALDRKLEEERETYDLSGELPPEKRTVDVYAAPDIAVEALGAWLGATGDPIRANLVIADESNLPPASARPKIEWIEKRLSDLRDARSYEKRAEILLPAIRRIVGDCEPVGTWLEVMMLDRPVEYKQKMLSATTLAQGVAGCDCDELDLDALRALLLGSVEPFRPERASVPLGNEALRRSDAGTVEQLVEELVADSDAE